MILEVFDVEHGACALVTTGNGKHILIDCGDNTSRGWEPGTALRTRGIVSIERLIVTNYDEDHVSGYRNLLENVVMGGLQRNNRVNAATIRYLKSEDGIGAGIQTLKRACCSAADLVRLILDRKLKWVGRASGERGYLSVRVDLDEVRAKVRGADHGGLTPRQVATMLGVADRVIYALMEGGHLTTRTVVNPINRCPQVIIMPAEVARFKKRYVSLFALAKERGKHFKAVKNELDAADVEPAFKRRKIGATFYRRSDC